MGRRNRIRKVLLPFPWGPDRIGIRWLVTGKFSIFRFSLPDELPQHPGHEPRRVFSAEARFLEHRPLGLGIGHGTTVEPHGTVDLRQPSLPVGIEPRVHRVSDAGVGDAGDPILVPEESPGPASGVRGCTPGPWRSGSETRAANRPGPPLRPESGQRRRGAAPAGR